MLLSALVSCGGVGSDESGLQQTVLTVETATPEVWKNLTSERFEYQIGAADAGSGGPWEGSLELVGRGAANYVEYGEPTDVLRAWVDLPPGFHNIQFRIRDGDGEVIWTFSSGSFRVYSDAPTEWYYLFDPRTADPRPVLRQTVLTVEAPDPSGDVDIDSIEYSLSCGSIDDVFLKTIYSCNTEAAGVLERVGQSSAGLGLEAVPTDLWQATHDVGCGPCQLTVTARDVEGTLVCFADLSFDVVGWGFTELPPEQVYVALPCAGELQ